MVAFSQSLLQRWFQERTSALWGQKLDKRESDGLQNSYGRLPYQLWNVNKYGSCFDAAITGIIPPPLLELQVRYLPLLKILLKLMFVIRDPWCYKL